MGKFAPYKVNLASMTEGHHEQDFVCDTQFFKNLEHDEILRSDVRAHLDTTRRGDVYDLTFTIKGCLEIPCDRCLDPMPHEVDTTYRLKVQYGEDYDDGTDNLLTIPQSDTSLNVAYILADTILLTIPLRHVHPMGKCNRTMAAVLHRHSAGSDPLDDDTCGDGFDNDENEGDGSDD